MARRGLLQELRRLLAPSTPLADITNFLRLHAKQLQYKQGLELFRDPGFKQIQVRMQDALPTIDGQSMCSFLYWARSSFESTAASRLEALPNAKSAETRITELCAMGAFRTRQLIPLLRDMRTLRLDSSSLEGLLEHHLANDHEQFTPEGLRQLLYILANLNSGEINVALLECALTRWNQIALQQVNVGLVAGTCSDLLRLSRCYRLPVITQTLWSAAELITNKAELLEESDLRYLLPSLMLAPMVPTDLVASLLKRANEITLTYQSRLALIALLNKPHFRSLFPPQQLNSLLNAMAVDLDSLSLDSLEGLLRSLHTCKQLPEELRAKAKARCQQSNSPAFLLQWAQFESDFQAYIAANEATLGNVTRDVPLRELMLSLLIVGTRTELPHFLKASLRHFDYILASKLKQQTLACINSFLAVESLYPFESLRFKPHYKAVLDQLVVYFPVNHVTVLKFLYQRMHEFHEEVKRALEVNKNRIEREDLQGLIRDLPVTEQLRDICKFLNLLRPILSINTLSQALKFDFQEIPPLYIDLISSVSGKFTTDPYFLSLSDRLLSRSTLPASLLTLLAQELEGKTTASEPVLRIASFLIEQNALTDQAKAKMIWLAQLSPSFPSHRILRKPSPTSCDPSLSSAVDHIILSSQSSDFSQSLQLAARELEKIPLLQALSVFEQYSVTDTRDEVTRELLSTMWPRITSAPPECKLRFLRAACEVQWGNSDKISTILNAVLSDYARISQEDKRILARVLGQLAYQGEAWNQVVSDLTSTKDDMRRNGPLLLHSLHQGRCLSRGLLRSVCRACLIQATRKPERMSLQELRQLLVAVLPTTLQNFLPPDAQSQLVEQLNQSPAYDFHTLLLQNYFLQHPAQVPFGTTATHQAVARTLFKHPLVTQVPEMPSQEEGAILGGGFLVPNYFPLEGKGLWISNRAVSSLNGTLLGDFAQYVNTGKTLVKLSFLTPDQLQTSSH